jgi:hypothetical protein
VRMMIALSFITTDSGGYFDGTYTRTGTAQRGIQ